MKAFFGTGLVIVLTALAVYVPAAIYFGWSPFSRPPFATVNTLILLDRSSSMGEMFAGETKLAASVEAVRLALGKEVRTRDNLAFRQFGGPCEGNNTELLVPFVQNNEGRVLGRLAGIVAEAPGGEKTMVDGLGAAIRDFNALAPLEGKLLRVIVITDGVDSCKPGDMLGTQDLMKRLQIDPDFYIITVDATNEQTKNLERIGQYGGWHILNAENPQQLITLVDQAVNADPAATPVTLPSSTPTPIAISEPARSRTSAANPKPAPPRTPTATHERTPRVKIILGLGPVIGIWLMLGQFLGSDSGSQATASQAGSFTFAALAAAAIAGASVLAFLFVRDPYRPQGLRRLPKLSDSFRREAVVAAVVNFGVWMPRMATFTILPIYAVQQGLTNPGLFLLIVALGSFPAKQITGRASDRYGFPVVFLPSLIVIGVSVLLIPMTHSAFGLLVLAAILGLGLGAAIPSLTAFAADSVSNEKRGAAINTFTLGRDLAMSGGALSLGFIAAHLGITAAFLVAGLSPVLAIAFYGAIKGLQWVRLRAEAGATDG